MHFKAWSTLVIACSLPAVPAEFTQESATQNVMKAPRCGVEDYPNFLFQQNPGKWGKKKLTYRVTGYSNKISKREVDETIRAAMKLWEDAADIKFQRTTTGEADIEISFHGDRKINREIECDSPFDGKSTNENPNKLAHAFYPKWRCNDGKLAEKISGDIHIDDDEDWPVIYHNKSHDLLHTMVHELGHSLGLTHQLNVEKYPTPNITSPIMQKFHPGFYPNLTLQLHWDDIKRIQELYGKPKTTEVPTPNTRKVPQSVPTPTVLQPPTGQRCKGRNYGPRRCCTPENPCEEGEGDCDGPGDGGQNDGHEGCKGHLVCGSNNCKKFGAYYHEKDDCCEKPPTSEESSNTEKLFSPKGWGSWGPFSQCTLTCGQGKKTRHRTCTGTSCTHTQQIQERLCKMTSCQEENHYGYIESIEPGAQHDTDNAIWGQDEWCNDGSWAVGMDLKILYNQGSVYDDNALNAIKLICSGQGGESNITSLEGSHGDWRGAKRCANGYITGVSLRSEKYQGKFKDDTAANGMRASCEDGEEIKSTNFEGYWGTWSGLEQCPQGTAICGIKTKVELSCFCDNVALTRTKFHCCSKQ